MSAFNYLIYHHRPIHEIRYLFPTQFFLQMDLDLRMATNMGSIHHARWMKALIYALWMMICGEARVKLGQAKAKGLLDLNFFGVYIYGRYWFAVPVTADAPFLTLSLADDLARWGDRDPSLSAKLLPILGRHTWYLTGRNVVFSLFSNLVNNSTKLKMAKKMLLPENAPCEIPLGKPTLPSIFSQNLEDYVDCESWYIFQVEKIQSVIT